MKMKALWRKLEKPQSQSSKGLASVGGKTHQMSNSAMAVVAKSRRKLRIFARCSLVVSASLGTLARIVMMSRRKLRHRTSGK
jgi:hypothetical protein